MVSGCYSPWFLCVVYRRSTGPSLLGRPRRWGSTAVERYFDGQGALLLYGHLPPRSEDFATPEGFAGVSMMTDLASKTTPL